MILEGYGVIEFLDVVGKVVYVMVLECDFKC